MKTKKFIKKVNRYLVLSKEFEGKESDLFEDMAVEGMSNPKSIVYTGGYTNTMNTDLQGSSVIFGHSHQPKTRAEIIAEQAEREIARAERYDEYLNLREELEKYTNLYTEIL